MMMPSSEPQTNRPKSLHDDTKTMKRLEMALKRSRELDQTEQMDEAAKSFRYASCRNEMWNPEGHSLMWGTWIWDQSSPAQKILLNQLYWSAYYSQIISAEIATIFFNQTSAAALYGVEDFRIVCDTLDLESAQERAHINAFKTVSESMEEALFEGRLFSYPMRTPFTKTMLYSDLGPFQQRWRKWQLNMYSLLSANSPFIGCQYFTVRGLRTLKGKIVQHQLSKHYTNFNDRDLAPIPSRIHYHHFMDESFHFNTSTVISHDVVNSLPEPTRFERMVANKTLEGCQRDHFHFSTAINGIFWYDPALFPKIYRVLRSRHFGMDRKGALQAMYKTFCQESEGMQSAAETHREAIDSYRNYLADFKFVSKENKEMSIMSRNNLARHLATNRREFARFVSLVRV